MQGLLILYSYVFYYYIVITYILGLAIWQKLDFPDYDYNGIMNKIDVFGKDYFQ